MATLTRYEALQEVSRAFVTQEAMAAAFEVTQPTIWRWLNQSKQLPAEKVLLAERLTGVSRHDLRPDIYPRERMTDQAIGLRYVGIDRRASSSTDRLAIGERLAQAG